MLYHLSFASIQFAVGLLLLHKAVPTALVEGRVKAFIVWFLGLMLLLFASGHIIAALYGLSTYWVNQLAQVAGTIYGVLRYRHIVRAGAVHWTEAT